MVAKTRTIGLSVNGAPVTAEVEARLTLADFLREELDLTGTHLACEHGVCGNCTVLVDGASARSCLMFAVQADGCAVTTVEGLARGNQLHPLQDAFWENHGLQCGFCTPAMLLTSVELLGRNQSPSDDQIREAIAGVLCRCTGYQNIVKSVQVAAGRMRTASPTSMSPAALRSGGTPS
jgi:aerobic-type carbon monoxide dehydrogenase small subunit (CoxS/CutS family)